MSEIVIVDGLRSPFIKFNTDFKDLPPQDLAAMVLKELLKRNNLKSEDIDEVIIGNVSQPPQLRRLTSHVILP